MQPRRVLTCLLALSCAGACTGNDDEAAPGFRLTIAPRFLPGQDVLAGGAVVELVFARPDGDVEVVHLGDGEPGAELSVDGVPPLEVGTALGLLVEDPGGTDGSWDRTLTRAYGQAVVEEEVGEGASLDVLVPAFAEIGELGVQPGTRQRVGACAAMIAGGDVYVFGGQEPGVPHTSEASDRIFALAEVDGGTTEFDQLTTRLPRGGLLDRTGRFAATATAVTVEGTGQILFAGGRGAENYVNGIDNFDTWHLFDPVTATFVDKGSMGNPHSSHLAVPFLDGKVLIYAGLSSLNFPIPMTFDVWDPVDRRSESGSDAPLLQTGYVQMFGARFGDDVVVCGGVRDDGPQSDVNHFHWQPRDACHRIRPNGAVDDFEQLPIPLAGAAMVELADGGLLVTGGFSDDIVDDLSMVGGFRNAPARADILRYRPELPEDDRWRGIGTMGHARAHHRMVRLADGRVVIVGGTTSGTAFEGPLPDAAACDEIFDPISETVQEMPCAGAGTGADPLVTAWPGEGVFVLEGHTRSDYVFYAGLERYGFASNGPPVEP